jgi:hypothetical protein
MIELLALFSFGAVVVLAVLGFMRPQHLKVSAAVGNANLTLEAEAGGAMKASPPREALESWARLIATQKGGAQRLLYAESLDERPAVPIVGSGNPNVRS